MARKQHIRNGRLLGVWYELEETGAKVYLGQRQMRHLNRHFYAWTIDLGTLTRCRDNGYSHVGIVCRRQGKKQIWLSPLEDWFDEQRSIRTRSKKFGTERGIRLKHFRIDPAASCAKIDASFRIR